MAWLSATPKEQEKPRREIVSQAQQELVDLDEYEQHLVKLWREVGSVSQGGAGVAPLVWKEVIEWADKFYMQDVVITVPKRTVKTSERWYRNKLRTETETIIEDIPVVVKQCALEDYELDIVMQLSREYCNEYYEASDPNRACPKEIFLDEIDGVANADAILEGFMSMWGNKETAP